VVSFFTTLNDPARVSPNPPTPIDPRGTGVHCPWRSWACTGRLWTEAGRQRPRAREQPSASHPSTAAGPVVVWQSALGCGRGPLRLLAPRTEWRLAVVWRRPAGVVSSFPLVSGCSTGSCCCCCCCCFCCCCCCWFCCWFCCCFCCLMQMTRRRPPTTFAQYPARAWSTRLRPWRPVGWRALRRRPHFPALVSWPRHRARAGSS
jgi:hypothetical protein